MANWQNRIIGEGLEDADQLLANPSNWRIHPKHQQDALAGVLDSVGWVQRVIVNKRTGFVVDGHMRVALAITHGEQVPVSYVDLSEDEEQLILATFDPISALAGADTGKLDELLAQVNTDNAAIQAMLAGLAEGAELYEQLFAVDKTAKPNPRQLPIDVIYTIQGADATCCLAVQAGLKYGIQSASFRLCPYVDVFSDERHAVCFVDNDYFNYDHKNHLEVVKKLRPKYATVRDVMTKKQCATAKIDFYELEQILDWAAELQEYSENVIVIPKYDCLADVPENYVLGYSIPTSHGGTPLAPELFKSRRVHLLGGSWKDQLVYMAILGESVISVDNNYVQNIAKQWAQFVTPNGETKNLTDEGYPYLNNPRYVALAMSFGAMGAKVNELYPTGVEIV